MSSGPRFQVLDEATHECCMKACVVDSSLPLQSDGNYAVEAFMCDCRERPAAERIAAALNKAAAQ